MSYKRTFEERETIINTTEADDTYDVYTASPKMQRMFRKFAEEYPHLCRVVKHDDFTMADSFVIDKKSLTIRPKKPISDERRQLLSERAKNMQLSTNLSRKSTKKREV